MSHVGFHAIENGSESSSSGGSGTFTEIVDEPNGEIALKREGTAAGQTQRWTYQAVAPAGLQSVVNAEFEVRRDGATNSNLADFERNGTDDPGATDVDVNPVANATFEAKTLTPTSSYSEGDIHQVRCDAVVDDLEAFQFRREQVTYRV